MGNRLSNRLVIHFEGFYVEIVVNYDLAVVKCCGNGFPEYFRRYSVAYGGRFEAKLEAQVKQATADYHEFFRLLAERMGAVERVAAKFARRPAQVA